MAKKKPSTVTLHREEALRDSRRQATSMALPLAINHRLDEIANRAPALSPSRAELIGMLIWQADLDEEELERMILRYRKLTVGDVISPEPHGPTAADTGDNVVRLQLRQAGRPPQRSAG